MTSNGVPKIIGGGKVEKRFGGVVFLDVLGTKEVLKRKDANQVIADFEAFVNDIKLTLETGNMVTEIVNKGGIIPLYGIKAFSDTIIITNSVKYEEQEKISINSLLWRTVNDLPRILLQGLQKEIFLRGSISFGEFYESDRMTIGEAIYEAARYYMLPEWIGISAAPSAHYQLTVLKKEMSAIDPLYYFVKWDIPVKGGVEKNGWALNWPNIKHERAAFKLDLLVKREEEYRTWLQKAKNTILVQMNTTDIDVSWKWRNTLDFYEKNLIL